MLIIRDKKPIFFSIFTILLLIFPLFGQKKTPLLIEQLKAPETIGCGGVQWLTTFDLPEKAQKPTLIIQKLNKKVEYRLCEKSQTKSVSLTYFEAWQVDPGQTSSQERVSGEYDYDDNYFLAQMPATRGSATLFGEIKVFTDRKLPPEMKRYNQRTSAGDLPSSTEEPEIWQSVTQSLPHNLEIKWDCCGEQPVIAVRTLPQLK